jgi:hypothetical protein
LLQKKWSKTSLNSLINHWITCHKIFEKDSKEIKNIINIKYEDLINNTDEVLKSISIFINLEIKNTTEEIRTGINDKYFSKWRKLSKSIFSKIQIQKITEKYNKEVMHFNYNLKDF